MLGNTERCLQDAVIVAVVAVAGSVVGWGDNAFAGPETTTFLLLSPLRTATEVLTQTEATGSGYCDGEPVVP